MDVRRRGFALIIALLATSAIFALAMQGAASSRRAVAEVIAIRDGAEAARDARSAACIALIALTTAGDRSLGGGVGVEEGSPAADPNVENP
ncbi:MAG: hypothetical protein VYC34_11855, partial [Planctomycetota bacterium]|nr:hypothetical protein [Planctomycetota bacterium]